MSDNLFFLKGFMNNNNTPSDSTPTTPINPTPNIPSTNINKQNNESTMIINKNVNNSTTVMSSISTQNFNIKFIWKEVAYQISKIISYLKDNKISEELQEVVSVSHYSSSNSSEHEKLNIILLILDKALNDNRSEELNVFFIEFYRLSSLYLFCIDDKIKAYEILNRFIFKINQNFKNKEEAEIDINLLIERDKLLLNKAQMLFWDQKYEECLAILFSKISYFQNDHTDEIYCLKMMNFIISILNYKAWAHVIMKDREEAEKSFLLAIQMIKDSKKLLKENFQEPDLKELYKREVKTFHQYMTFLNIDIMNAGSAENSKELDKGLLLEYTKTSYKLVSEILKVLAKENFEYDEDIHKSHLLFYYLQASLLSLSVTGKWNEVEYNKALIKLNINPSNPSNTFNDNNKKNQIINSSIINTSSHPNHDHDHDKIDLTTHNLVDLENTLMFLMNCVIENCNVDMNCKIKYRHILNNCTFRILKIIHSKDKIIINNNIHDENSHSIGLESVYKRLKEIIVTYDETGVSVMKDIIDINFQSPDFYFTSQILIKNFAMHNIERFSEANMNKKINDQKNVNVNEIFVVEYICNKILFVLAKIMNDSVDKFKNFDDRSIVLESLNGYLILKSDSIILVTMNSIFTEYKIVNSEENMDDFQDKFLSNRILNEIKLEKSDSFYHFYSKHHFEIKKDTSLDIYNTLLLLNFFYSLELYKPSISLLNFLLGEFDKLKGYFSGKNEHKRTQGYLDLYLFLTFFAVKIYMKIGDYFLAVNRLLGISEYDYDYSFFLYNVLFGICLTKLKFSDLGSVFLDSGWNYIQLALEEESEFKINNNDEEKNKENEGENNKFNFVIDNTKINENFIKPIRMFICVVNLMKIKAIEKFQHEILINASICFNCGIVDNTNDEANIDTDVVSKKLFSCLKCNRANYCSFKCMRDMKSKHDLICYKYSEKFAEINEIVDKYIK